MTDKMVERKKILIEKETDESLKSIKAYIANTETETFIKQTPFPKVTIVWCPGKDQAITNALKGFLAFIPISLNQDLGFLSDFMVHLFQYYSLESINPKHYRTCELFMCSTIPWMWIRSLKLYNLFMTQR